MPTSAVGQWVTNTAQTSGAYTPSSPAFTVPQTYQPLQPLHQFLSVPEVMPVVQELLRMGRAESVDVAYEGAGRTVLTVRIASDAAELDMLQNAVGALRPSFPDDGAFDVDELGGDGHSDPLEDRVASLEDKLDQTLELLRLIAAQTDAA